MLLDRRLSVVSVLSVCLSVLSATFVYCGQTVRWINMKLGPGHIVLDGDPAPPPQKGHCPQFSAHVWLDELRCHLVRR